MIGCRYQIGFKMAVNWKPISETNQIVKERIEFPQQMNIDQLVQDTHSRRQPFADFSWQENDDFIHRARCLIL